jgi:glycosyltransferase involved in cell wall biosynthesis
LLSWFAEGRHRHKFGRVLLVQHLANEGLSSTRNTALSLIDTPYTFILDADNLLYPRALNTLRAALENSGAAMAYSLIERFGVEQSITNNEVWSADELSHGPYIDAMSMLRTDVVRELGGYRSMPSKFGWEDYDLWCKLVDHEFSGCLVPQILCRYRVHLASMTATMTRAFVTNQLAAVREDFQAHHRMPFHFGS